MRPGLRGNINSKALEVLDRDYFTVEVNDILKVRTPLTMVGGRIIQLQASLASELGIPPVGPSYNFSDAEIEAQYLGTSGN